MGMIENKIWGCLFGQAIGDALGLGTEFLTADQVLQYYPRRLMQYRQIIRDSHRERWRVGEWTDDTDMMLCIAEAIIEDGTINLTTIARNFKKWFNEHPMGIGRNTYNVLCFSDYLQDPFRAAEIVWKLSGRKSAANGGIMRTSIVGLWNDRVSDNASDICKLTHSDPRCVGSCVILSELINGWVWHNKELSFYTLLELGERYDKRIKPYLLAAKESELGELFLDDEKTMGYTLKALSAAVWCLYHVCSFKEGLEAIVNAGGDADTNAAVACSLLGAKYGYTDIPDYYIENLYAKERLRNTVQKLTAILVKKFA